MSTENKNQIIYNNYFIIVDPNSINSEIKDNLLFKPLMQNFLKKTFLSQKRKGPENKIILNEETENNIEIDFNINKNIKNFVKEINLEKTKEDTQEKDKNINDINVKELNDNKNVFFDIYKKSKKGRKSQSNLVKTIHTKYSHDNILRKIKVKFLKRLTKFINNIIKIKYKGKIKELVPLNGEIAQNNNISFNLKLLNSKIKEIFLSHDINGKFTSFDKCFNKKVIDSIYDMNIQELIDIFEMTFLEVFNHFISIKETNKLNGLEKLDTVINEIKTKEKNDQYIKKFISVANDFEKYFTNKNPRKSKIFN
jgi:hypothetical protein